MSRYLFGHGLVTTTISGVVLDAHYESVHLIEADNLPDILSLSQQYPIAEYTQRQIGDVPLRKVSRDVKTLLIDVDAPPTSAEDVYLRLHALSLCLVRPNEINLEDLFNLLNNVVWTNFGPCSVEDFGEVRARLEQKFGMPVQVYSIDKIPRMVDYIVPQGVRIADAGRVRLGAHLAPGTTVMHEGFCNFNAGTLGVSMVEGRISQGVVVGDGSDIGGGASIMGTLSGGGKERVSIGERSLLGANAGLGIALGDDCIVESGLYLTAGSKVEYNGEVVKARELSGVNSLLFIRDSLSGKIMAKVRKTEQKEILNTALHAN